MDGVFIDEALYDVEQLVGSVAYSDEADLQPPTAAAAGETTAAAAAAATRAAPSPGGVTSPFAAATAPSRSVPTPLSPAKTAGKAVAVPATDTV